MLPSDQTPDDLTEEERLHRISSLRDMIMSAEKTIQGAKAMLLQLEGKKKSGRPRKLDDTNGTVIEGTFDGQVMVGTDGKRYPVPANYASKSKLIEGDFLKLTITSDGSFVYKQIGPAPRRTVIGVIGQDDRGNYYAVADGKPYKVLLASITYFRAEPGDEVVLIIPQTEEATWAALEGVISKNSGTITTTTPRPQHPSSHASNEHDTTTPSTAHDEHADHDAQPKRRRGRPPILSPLDEWTAHIAPDLDTPPIAAAPASETPTQTSSSDSLS